MARLRMTAVTRHFRQAALAATMHAKGAQYEAGVRELFEGLPRVEVILTNVKGVFESEEIDAGLWVGGRWCGLPLEELVVPVEVKGWTAPVGSSEVSWFVGKLRKRSITEGILIAANGITGDSALLTAAQDEIQTALQDGIRILVITESEILELRTSTELVDLLKRKQARLRLARAAI